MAKDGYKIRNPKGIYFLSFAVVQWLDVFTKPEYAQIIIVSLKYCQTKKGLNLYAWCLMSNHLHLICSSQHGDLSSTLRDFKSFTSKEIIKAIQSNVKESRKDWMLWLFKNAGLNNSRNTKFQFWRQDNQPKELLPDLNSFALQKLHYIHNNPVVAGLVDYAEEYKYSSARNYAGKHGLIEVLLYE
ncbi:MAG: putative transposase [Chitinophagales bacterium]|jgi:putative transposase